MCRIACNTTLDWPRTRSSAMMDSNHAGGATLALALGVALAPFAAHAQTARPPLQPSPSTVAPGPSETPLVPAGTDTGIPGTGRPTPATSRATTRHARSCSDAASRPRPAHRRSTTERRRRRLPGRSPNRPPRRRAEAPKRLWYQRLIRARRGRQACGERAGCVGAAPGQAAPAPPRAEVGVPTACCGRLASRRVPLPAPEANTMRPPSDSTR